MTGDVARDHTVNHRSVRNGLSAELEGGHKTMTELGRETRICDLRLARSEKIEISVQDLDVRDEWGGKL